jgi:hypothetical protein
MDLVMKRGEIYFANLDPSIGSEIAKRRPVLIVSNNTYILQQNKRTTGGKGQESGKRSRSEKTAKPWKPFLYKPRP